MTKLAQLADSARIDWAGLGLATVALVAYFCGIDIDAAMVLVGTILAAFGRGVAITVKRKAQQEHLVEIAKGATQLVKSLRQDDVSDEVTSPIDVEERQG